VATRAIKDKVKHGDIASIGFKLIASDFTAQAAEAEGDCHRIDRR
jgi:hypothetical protein